MPIYINKNGQQSGPYEDHVVIDQVLDELAQLDVLELVVEQHVVDEQAVHALQLADHLAADLRAVLVDDADRFEVLDELTEDLEQLAALAFGQEQIFDDGRGGVKRHARPAASGTKPNE